MKNRNIALSIIFSLISCGIYAIYWSYRLVVESDELTGNQGGMSPIVVVILGWLTGGIYWWIWLFQCGKRLDEKNGTSNAVIYLLLAIFGLAIVDFAMIQNEINKVTAA